MIVRERYTIMKTKEEYIELYNNSIKNKIEEIKTEELKKDYFSYNPWCHNRSYISLLCIC